MNRHHVISRLFVALSSLLMLSVPALSHANAPEPVTFVVPYAPGGPLDVAARALAQALEPAVGPVIVQNKPGAGGSVGMSFAKRRAGDGRTWVMGAVATQAVNPHIYRHLSYDPLADFKPVTLIAHVPNVLLVTPAFARAHHIDSTADLIAYARRHPDALNYASGGNGSAGHMAAEWLKHAAGIQMQHIPYNGAASARLSVLSGQTDLIFDNLASALTAVQAGKLVALAVTTAQRTPLLPAVPTMREAGIEGFDISTWYGVLVPASTPDATVARLNRQMTDALKSPALDARLAKLGAMVTPTTPEAFDRLIRRDYDKYGRIVKISGARVD